jgi:glycosyltransferase involved in cell wall biosynthesis
MLVLSHVVPFPRSNGQQQRVYYTLRAARQLFQITFVSVLPQPAEARLTEELKTVSDEVVPLPSRYGRSPMTKLWHRTRGLWFSFQTGLRFSNYLIGKLEFAPSRIEPLLAQADYDCALFEYWHATESVPVFRQRGIPCVLDMHNVLWQSHLQKLGQASRLAWWKRRSSRLYQAREEAAWQQFDGVIAITREEEAYLRPRVPKTTRVFYAPMGVDLAEWPFGWEPSQPKRLAFYGGLGSAHNQEAAWGCYQQIMPAIWCLFPDTELWLVGSNPSAELRALGKDPRVKVTGFVEKVGDVLRTMSAVLCPWKGTYGFRSRLVEVMALGVPVVATPEAIQGMELEHEKGLLLGPDPAALSRQAIRLLKDTKFAQAQSRLGRQEVERLYSMPNTYGRLAAELNDWLLERKGSRRAA